MDDFKKAMQHRANRLSKAVALSPSQLGQDLFVLHQLNWKRGGYSVEFGATDGKLLSNSWLLDRHFGWQGILAKPGRAWRDALIAQQRNAHLEFACVWSETGATLTFTETADAEFSTLSEFAKRDQHDRSDAQTYDVETISLLDMLDKFQAPAVIDYLSMDTEGSEIAILEAFDFSRYRFRCITCEHNYTPDRERIFALLSRHGYRRVHERFSQYDDWYVSED
jgi:FkbM family methyltransferase